MADFSERIKALRCKHGMTQEALGKIIGVRQDSIYTYEKGKNYPEVRNLMILADYFGVSTDYLLGRTDNPEINR
ncbi:MAG: helix-turn-helix domain-containing protein [Oscillospiraceae bacterium]|nr:helix-turn-helix domain-containing protein [Oscillospiraceae bacterium]